MPGILENAFAIPGLNDLTLFHHHDLVGNVCHHSQVVADKNHTDIAFLLQLGDQLQNLGLDCYIECCGWFIGDQQLRFVDQRHGDHHALTHTAGKLVGEVIYCRLGVAHSHFRQQLDSPGAGLFFAHLMVKYQWLHQLFADGHVGVEAGHGILEDHGNVAAAYLAQLRFTQL